MSTTERKRSRAGGAGKRGASPMPMRTTAEIEADSVSRTVRELNRRRALIEENVRARMARGETFPARAPSFDLAEHLRDFVRDAVQSGEVLYDPATGLAYVKEASHPPFPDVGEPGWGTAEWDAEAERRRLIRERESNLKFALGDPRLQAHALLWLDAPAVETGMLSRWGAARHSECDAQHGSLVASPPRTRPRDDRGRALPRGLRGRAHASRGRENDRERRRRRTGCRTEGAPARTSDGSELHRRRARRGRVASRQPPGPEPRTLSVVRRRRRRELRAA